jgi:fructokinase
MTLQKAKIPRDGNDSPMKPEDKATIYGGIEAGGTKFVCAVGSGPDDLRQPGNRVSFPTGDNPAALLRQVVEWFKQREAALGGKRLTGLGMACFGPVDLDPASSSYGFITSTPKPGWRNTDVLTPLREAFAGVPLAFDTDVNGAALGEKVWGAAQGLDDFIYITIGTGIGAGAMARGQLLHGLVHPEIGHIRLPRLPGDMFPGVCPYHGDCWEGLCAGPAIEKRGGQPGHLLPADHPAWDSVAHYVGFALANLVCTLSPKRIIIGGSVRKAGQLGEHSFFSKVRTYTRQALNGYVHSPSILTNAINDYIVPPLLGDDAGVSGAIALARAARQPSP